MMFDSTIETYYHRTPYAGLAIRSLGRRQEKFEKRQYWRLRRLLFLRVAVVRKK